MTHPRVFHASERWFRLLQRLYPRDFRDEMSDGWADAGPPTSPAPDIAQWSIGGLQAGRRYAYEICLRPPGAEAGVPSCEYSFYAGSAATTAPPGDTGRAAPSSWRPR